MSVEGCRNHSKSNHKSPTCSKIWVWVSGDQHLQSHRHHLHLELCFDDCINCRSSQVATCAWKIVRWKLAKPRRELQRQLHVGPHSNQLDLPSAQSKMALPRSSHSQTVNAVHQKHQSTAAVDHPSDQLDQAAECQWSITKVNQRTEQHGSHLWPQKSKRTGSNAAKGQMSKSVSIAVGSYLHALIPKFSRKLG